MSGRLECSVSRCRRPCSRSQTRSSNDWKACHPGYTAPLMVSKMTIRGFIQRFFASNAGAAPNNAARQQVPGKSRVLKTRRRLFTKYVALFVAVVCVALLSNGVFDVFFYYQEHKVSLIRIQREQAEAAAAKIGQFVKEIESQLGWTTQLPWSAGSIEQR